MTRLSIFLTDQQAIGLISQDLGYVRKWCTQNKLSLNTKKTKAVAFATKAIAKNIVRGPLKIRDEVAFTPTYNYLGVTLDNKLDFKKHVGVLNTNTDHKLYLFRSNRNDMNEGASVNVFKTMILPMYTRPI